MNSSTQAVCDIISKTLDAPVEDLRPETPLRSLPNMESMKVLEVILKVERKFGIEIPDDATFRLETVGEFAKLVDDLRQQQSAFDQVKVASA